MRRFLLVDDEINVLHALQRTLRHHVHEKDLHIELFTEPQKALERCVEAAFDLVISDYRMPEINGVDFLKTVKLIQPDAVRLMLSASSELQGVLNAVNEAEVFRYITKPWQVQELEDIIRLAFAHHDKVLEDRSLADQMRVQRGEMSAQEVEAKRLEEQEPGITKVNWGPDGSVYLD
ncbi:MAG TPA: response regulator [Burkholderiaceae bacterium]|nr:response regulator [Burkholderiaceae bacterium]